MHTELARVAHGSKALLKVILENAYLSDDEAQALRHLV